MLLIVQKIIILSLLTVKLYTCQWPGVVPQLYSSFRVLTCCSLYRFSGPQKIKTLIAVVRGRRGSVIPMMPIHGYMHIMYHKGHMNLLTGYYFVSAKQRTDYQSKVAYPNDVHTRYYRPLKLFRRNLGSIPELDESYTRRPGYFRPDPLYIYPTWSKGNYTPVCLHHLCCMRYTCDVCSGRKTVSHFLLKISSFTKNFYTCQNYTIIIVEIYWWHYEL